jgi:hypothetical protein
MNKILIIAVFLFLQLSLPGQTPVGSWSDHLAYSTVDCIALSSSEVFASTGSSLLIYNKSFSELKKMSRIDGLSETGISTISWSEENSTLIIAYTSANIDLLKNNEIYNLPDVNRKYIPGKKTINRIRTSGNYAYLACSFGIVVIDLIKKEVYDTWKPGTDSESPEVYDIAFGNGNVYAATGSGVFSAGMSDPGLSYFGNWKQVNIQPNPSGKYTSLVYSATRLYANLSDPNQPGDHIYVVDGESSEFSFAPGVFYNSFDNAPNGFTLSSSSLILYYNINGSLLKNITSYSQATPDITQAIVDNNNDIWIADKNSGLVKGENLTTFSALTLPGPISNNALSITSLNGKTIITGGGITGSWNNLNLPLQISIFENNTWNSISTGSIRDPLRTFIDPGNSNHYFVSSWGGGLIEYENNILKNHYTEANSPLQTIIAGSAFVRVCGMAMDKSGNLWITQTEVPGSIKVLKPDGTWIVNPVTISAPSIGDIIITTRGQKWIVLPRGYGLFVLDDNKTPEVFTDDKSIKVLVQDTEDQPISFIYSIAEDLDGNIWVGTDQGPVVYYNPEKIFDGTARASRIKIPRNDGTDKADYVLKTETITSIAVDGANRKWLGTSRSGVYMLSADGTKQIKNFSEQNSPLISNSIVSLAIDNKTGEVWFGTSKGVQSYRGDATEGQEKFSKIYTFPNPVREDFLGNVTITGLIRDTQIRITDISGNLVYETISDGGEATWDLKTYNGKRVSTGVYLVFCASKDGSQSAITKMLIIK